MRWLGAGAVAVLGVVLTTLALAQTVAPPPAHPVQPRPPSAAERTVPAPSMPVDINNASAAELGKVRYIGRKRAQAIIAGRPWKHPEDLVAKQIVPRKYYDQIKDHLVAKQPS